MAVHDVTTTQPIHLTSPESDGKANEDTLNENIHILRLDKDSNTVRTLNGDTVVTRIQMYGSVDLCVTGML